MSYCISLLAFWNKCTKQYHLEYEENKNNKINTTEYNNAVKSINQNIFNRDSGQPDKRTTKGYPDNYRAEFEEAE